MHWTYRIIIFQSENLNKRGDQDVEGRIIFKWTLFRENGVRLTSVMESRGSEHGLVPSR
jgi:hypothetical protein